eukprot:g1587.t1
MSNLTFETRVKALMNEMNVSEKLNVLNQESVPRLHIPNDGFNEALHGVAWAGRATVFPCPMGMASTWNTDLIHEMGIVVSYEALAKHKNGTNALSFYAPNINIVRDVRWGRAQETYGEDPTLTGLMASAYINGMQFPRGKNDSLAVRNVAKHFAAYNLESNFAVGGTDGQFRLSYDANVSTEDLENTFLPAFREIVSDVSGVMCAYNSVNGTPICANNVLIHDILRDQMKFNDGIVVTDCGAIDFMISNHKWNHSDGRPYNRSEVASATLAAGTDLNCGTAYSMLPQALKENLLNPSDIDLSVRRQLLGYMRLGLFQDTQTDRLDWRRNISMDVVDSSEHRDLALRIAAESVIVLKNHDELLPLGGYGMANISSESPRPMKLAVIGPNANRTLTLTSNYAGCKDAAGGPILSTCTFVNPLQGIRNVAKSLNHLDDDVEYATGCDIDTDRVDGFEEAVSVAKDADVVILVLGLITCQETGDQCIEAEARDRSTGSNPPLDFGTALPGKQELLLETLANSTNTSIVVVIESGSAVSVPWAKSSDRISAIVQHFYSGVLGGEALAQVLTGLQAPSGRLPLMIPYDESSLPKDYLDQSMTATPGRTHRYFKGDPLFRFGFGMEYSTFDLATPRVEISNNGELAYLAVNVTNRGEYVFNASKYVVNVFASPTQQDSSLVEMLVGFSKITLNVGQMREVRVEIPIRRFALSSETARTFELRIGPQQQRRIDDDDATKKPLLLSVDYIRNRMSLVSS